MRSRRNRYGNLDVDETRRRSSGFRRRPTNEPSAYRRTAARRATQSRMPQSKRPLHVPRSFITDRPEEHVGGPDVGLSVGAFDQRQLREILRIGCFVDRVVRADGIDARSFPFGQIVGVFLPDCVSGPRLSGSASFCGPPLCVTTCKSESLDVRLPQRPLPLVPARPTTTSASVAPAGTVTLDAFRRLCRRV